MTRLTSDIPVQKLLDTFLKYEELRMQAVRKLDVPAANRNLLKASAASKALTATPEGRTELEALLAHPTLYIRMAAAGAMMAWAPEIAIPIFGRLLDADLTAIRSVDERLDIRITAGDWLYEYFGILNHDHNKLIEPLRAYGIELSYRDDTKWQ